LGARFIKVPEFIRIEDQADWRERYAEEEEDLSFAKIVPDPEYSFLNQSHMAV
jgi:hypothetical protein